MLDALADFPTATTHQAEGWFDTDQPRLRTILGTQAVRQSEWLKMTYEYDLGDSWMHEITIEHIADLETQTVSEEDLWFTPRCLESSRACPPEDAGGPGGYARFLEAWRDPAHPEHEQMRQWAGASYDPEIFSVQQANSALANLE